VDLIFGKLSSEQISASSSTSSWTPNIERQSSRKRSPAVRKEAVWHQPGGYPAVHSNLLFWFCLSHVRILPHVSLSAIGPENEQPGMRPADAKQLRFGLPDYSCAIKALARQMRRLASGDHSGNILAALRRRNLKKIAGNEGSQK
jgi:hypothetical protein